MPLRPRKFALFTAEGRLGNQMFVAAFLDGELEPGDMIGLTGMDEFLTGFVWNRFRSKNLTATVSARYRKRAKRWLYRIGRTAAALRIVSSIRQRPRTFVVDNENYRVLGEEIARRDGLFKRLLFIDKGYFQSSELADHATFRLKDEYLTAARSALAALPPGPRAFVHVRCGDYKSWQVFGRSPLLDIEYFRRGIELIRAVAPDTQFILVSDEIEAVRASIGGVHIFNGANVYEDLGLMMLCDGGVIANSTFSWWGAFFCRKTLPIVSPKGWLTHGLGTEYPIGITADWMTAIEP